MQSLAQLRKCVYPFPVYVATFADGTTGRITVWQAADKPWNWERFRKVSGQCFGHLYTGAHGLKWPRPKRVIRGYLEHDGKRIADPMVAEAKPARVNSKAMVRELLKMIEGGYWSPEAYAQALRWAA